MDIVLMRYNKITTQFFWLCALMMLTTVRCIAQEAAGVTNASDSALILLQKAIKTEDSGLLSSLFTEDGSIITADGYQVSGRFRIRMAAKMAMISGDDGELTVVRDSITTRGALYTETGSYSFRITESGASFGRVFKGHYRILWSKENNVWKIKQATGLK